MQADEGIFFPSKVASVHAKMCDTWLQASSLDEVSHYYVLTNKQEKLGFIVYDPLRMSAIGPRATSLR